MFSFSDITVNRFSQSRFHFSVCREVNCPVESRNSKRKLGILFFSVHCPPPPPLRPSPTHTHTNTVLTIKKRHTIGPLGPAIPGGPWKQRTQLYCYENNIVKLFSHKFPSSLQAS